jgi:coenzyme F420-dependent glucose-6-phosphate dehydrogenase
VGRAGAFEFSHTSEPATSTRVEVKGAGPPDPAGSGSLGESTGIGAEGPGDVALRIGYKASAEQFAPRELVEYAVRAEEVGLDSVVTSDHFLPWRHEGGHAPSSLAWFAAVGERTSRVQIGTSVLTPTFRYNPAVLAQTFATLGLLYPGRVMLGVGTGEALNEIAVSGREWPEFKERFARLRESVRLMRALWTEGEVSFDGEYYRTVGATIYDRPEQPVPVYVAAGGPVVARYAGRYGDGFICTSGKGMDLYTEKLIPAVQEGAAAAERDPAEVDRMIEVKMSYDRDPATALENCRFWAPLSLTAEQKHSVDSAVEMERLADELPIEHVAKRWIVASDPDEAVAQIKPYVDAGLNHLVFHGPGADQERFLTQFAEDVLPRLRALG